MGDNSTAFPATDATTVFGDSITGVIAGVIDNVTSNVTDALFGSNDTNGTDDNEYDYDYDFEIPPPSYYMVLAKGMWLYAPPVLLAIGTIGNGLSAVVMLRKELGHGSTTSLYLAVLAFVDLAVLYTGLLRHWINNKWAVDVRGYSNAACRAHTFFTYALMQYQAWIIVNVTTERLVAVFVPHKASLIFTRKLVVTSLLVTAVLVAAINAHFFWTASVALSLLGYRTGDDGEREPIYSSAARCSYASFVKIEWPWIDLTLFSLAPSAILIVSNVAIIVKIARASRAHVRTASAQAKITTMTIVLLTVSVVFLLTTAPVSVYFVFKKSLGLGFDEGYLMWTFVNLIMYVNNTVNFFLYCISGTRFRREVAALLCGCFRRKGAKQTESRSRNVTQTMSLSTVQ